MKHWITLCLVFLVLLLLCSLSFFIAGAYDEGMIEELFLSQTATVVFIVLQFPLLTYQPIESWFKGFDVGFYERLLVNIMLDTVCIATLVEWIRKLYSKSDQ